MSARNVVVHPPRGNRLLVGLAVALGLVLVATAAGMIWFMSDRRAWATEMPSTAGRDARAACALLGKVPPLSTPDFTGHGGYQLAGAASLAQAAFVANPHFRALSDALSRADMIVGAQQADPRAPAALANARMICANN